MKDKKENFGASLVATHDEALCSVSDLHDVDHRWVLDSGASYHMTPDRSWFVTFEVKEGSNILMGNNAACKVMILVR